MIFSQPTPCVVPTASALDLDFAAKETRAIGDSGLAPSMTAPVQHELQEYFHDTIGLDDPQSTLLHHVWRVCSPASLSATSNEIAFLGAIRRTQISRN